MKSKKINRKVRREARKLERKAKRKERKEIRRKREGERKRARMLRKGHKRVRRQVEMAAEVKTAGGKIEESSIDISKSQFVHPLKKKKKFDSRYVLWFLSASALWAGAFYVGRGVFQIITSAVVIFVLFQFYFYVRRRLKISEGIKKMEEVFPDFISLMSSNLRAGMTIDQALLMSARSEFAPLDKQINQVGKDIITGKEIHIALNDMGKRILSDKISKTIALITSGIEAGGNLSVLLEETALNMRERNYVEKRAASNVLMYVIFIFFAVAIGAPLLFGLSSVLVEILTNIMMNLPEQQTNVNLPFTLTQINVSVNFVIYYAVIFIIVTDILAAMVLGLVSKGAEREGFKYVLPLIVIGVTIFFTARFVMLRYFSGVFG